MKQLLLASVFLFATSAFATHIVRTEEPQQVKTFEGTLTVKTKCEILVATDPESGKNEHYCSCVRASYEISDVVIAAYPTAVRLNFLPSSYSRPMNVCTEDFEFTGTVTYTQTKK